MSLRRFVAGCILAVWLSAFLVSSPLTIGFPSPSEQKIAFEVRISGEEIPAVGEELLVEIILKFAAQGIQGYELIFHVGDASGAAKIARIEKIEGRAINAEHFQVVSKSDFSIWFKAVDVENVIQPGATDVVLATITLRALLVGRSVLGLEVPTVVDDKGHEVDPKNILIMPAHFEVK